MKDLMVVAYLDDYMVDLMVRRLRAAVTNEVPGGNTHASACRHTRPKSFIDQ